MKKIKIAAVLLAAALLCGCTEDKENLPKNSAQLYNFSSAGSSAESGSLTNSTRSSSEEISSSSEGTSSSSEGTNSSSEDEDEEIPYEERSSTGKVWDYPINKNLSYNFASADIIKDLEKRYDKTGAELGYEGEWCAEVISDILLDNHYNIEAQYNPCDLAIQLLNNRYAKFFCLREENYESLVYYGLNKNGRNNVIMTSHEDFVPKRGDLICFLWFEEDDIFNWSHIGIVAEDYDGKVLRTIEGNVGVSEFPDDPKIRKVGGREREYNKTVVGFIRLNY